MNRTIALHYTIQHRCQAIYYKCGCDYLPHFVCVFISTALRPVVRFAFRFTLYRFLSVIMPRSICAPYHQCYARQLSLACVPSTQNIIIMTPFFRILTRAGVHAYSDHLAQLLHFNETLIFY